MQLVAKLVKGDLQVTLSFSVFYSITCPCSSALSRQLFQQAFAKEFCSDNLEFEKVLKSFPVFSVKDIQKQFPDFDNRRLVEWQQKGYLVKVKRGYYCFSERNRGEQFMYFAANKIYSPSYISFESALA